MEFDFSKQFESEAEIPDQFRPMFTKGQDGKFAVASQFVGAAEAVTGLNKALKAARAEAKSSKVDLSPLSNFGSTPAEIAESVNAKIAQIESQIGEKGKVNLDKIRQELAEAHAKDLAAHTKRSEALKGQLYNVLVENAATQAIVEMKGVPELLLPFVREQIRVAEDAGQFSVRVVDKSGDQRYSGVTGQPMTLKELVAEMKSNEKYGRLFESEAAGGSGTRPGSTSAPRPGTKQMSSIEKIASGIAKNK